MQFLQKSDSSELFSIPTGSSRAGIPSESASPRLSRFPRVSEPPICGSTTAFGRKTADGYFKWTTPGFMLL